MITATTEALPLNDFTTHVDEEEGRTLFFTSYNSHILHHKTIITILGQLDSEAMTDL